MDSQFSQSNDLGIQPGEIPLIHPNGDFVAVPEAEVQSALKTGFSVPSSQQLENFTKEQKLQGPVGTTTAAAQGLVEGAVPFLGAKLLSKVGPGPEEENKQTLRELKEAHPIAHTAGQVAGVILDPVGIFGLLGKGGEAAGKGVELAAEKLGAGALSEVAGTGANLALQGAGMSAANVSNDLALGDPSLTAEKAISEIGFGALISGGLGVGASALGKGAKAAIKGIDLFDSEGAGGRLKEAAIKKFAQASSLVNGKDPEEIIDLIKQAQLKEVKGLESVGGKAAKAAIAAKILGLPGWATGAAVGAYEALKEPAVAMSKLVKLQGLIEKTHQVIESSAKSLISSSPISAGEIAGFASSKLSEAKYNEIEGDLREVAGNPAALAQHMANQFGALSQYAPEVASQAHITGAAGATFLMSKLPVKDIQNPLEAPQPPSQAQIFKFSQYYNAVNDPTSILSHAKKGTLTQEQIEAVSTVYPKLYGEMQKALLSEIASKKNAHTIPYQRKLMISMMLGQPVDKSLVPQSMISNQMALGISQMQQQAKEAAFIGQPRQQRTRVSGLNKLSLSTRNLTPMQMANQRVK